MKTYSEKEMKAVVRDALTSYIVQTAASISAHAGSGQEAARDMLRDAAITPAEIGQFASDENAASRLLKYLG